MCFPALRAGLRTIAPPALASKDPQPQNCAKRWKPWLYNPDQQCPAVMRAAGQENVMTTPATTPVTEPIDPDFDEARRDRIGRVGQTLFGGLILCGVYLFLGLPFATQLFQGVVATILAYGSTFYVNRNSGVRQLWFWKAVLATLPVHLLYVVLIFCSDARFPEFMTKAVVFIPVLGVGFAAESAFILDPIANYFEPPEPDGVDHVADTSS